MSQKIHSVPESISKITLLHMDNTAKNYKDNIISLAIDLSDFPLDDFEITNIDSQNL